MIRVVNKLLVVFLVGAIGSSVALAKTVRKQVRFMDPVVVNGTVLKSGTYDAEFDDQTNELTILRGRKVVAHSPAQLEKRMPPDKAAYVTRTEDGDSNAAILVSVTLKDGNQATITDSANKATGQ